MSQSLQPGGHLLSERIFQEHRAGVVSLQQLESTPIQGGLGIQIVVDQGREDLQVPLRLHHASHDAEGGE